MLHETYAIGADSGTPYAHSAQEAGLVTRGAVEVTVGDQSRILREGDLYYFGSTIPHRFRNIADGTSTILIRAVTPPTYWRVMYSS